MGKYAVIVVLSMVFALMMYGAGLQDSLRLAQEEMINDYNTAQASHIANSISMIAVQKLSNPDDDSFTPDSGQTFQHPGNGDYVAWEEMLGEYRIEVYNQGDSLLTVTTTARVDEDAYQTELRDVFQRL
ncbi:MAG: hypothetical protein U5K69_21135 [Balneolaceae bacterium]|nr:hypothetical protein [Balneolaceae bacterium]